jgi:hypothetical protein
MKTKTTDTPRTDEACEAMGLKAFVVPVNDQQHTENVNDHWRELDPDEVIQEGDEVMDLECNWQKAEISIGSTPKNRCTKARRPLTRNEVVWEG